MFTSPETCLKLASGRPCMSNTSSDTPEAPITWSVRPETSSENGTIWTSFTRVLPPLELEEAGETELLDFAELEEDFSELDEMELLEAVAELEDEDISLEELSGGT